MYTHIRMCERVKEKKGKNVCKTSGNNHIHTNKRAHKFQWVCSCSHPHALPVTPAVTKNDKERRKTSSELLSIGILYMDEKNIFTMFNVINFRIEQHEDV